jgi:hypothetical protein
LGSDDAVKVWLNGALVQANNAERGLSPGRSSTTLGAKASFGEI